jgi:hypothetical protein
MAEQTVIKLGEREFTLKPLAITPNRKWREQYETTVKPHFDRLSELGESMGATLDVTRAMPLVRKTLIEAEPDVLESLLSYSPELAGQREWIENNASSDEVFQAWREALRLSSPLGFGGLFDILNGPRMSGTSPKSPSANGASPKNKSKSGGRKRSEKVTTPPTSDESATKPT